MLEDRLHNFDDIVFSCFLPDDWLNEFRMPQHVLVYVYAGFLIKRTFMIHHTMRIVWWNPPPKPSRKNCSATSAIHSASSVTKTFNSKHKPFIHTTKVFIPIIFYSLPVQTVQSTVADRTVHYGRLYSPLQWTVEGFSIKALNQSGRKHLAKREDGT